MPYLISYAYVMFVDFEMKWNIIVFNESLQFGNKL
jgi:hypothetical protein